jgi:hypothetical protein
MHHDQTSTHIISCILHIASSKDSEPWPLVIEDYAGNTNQVVLTAGDLVLYESAKAFHGRPHQFIGNWYTSLFIHYYPKGWDRNSEWEAHYAVPPAWDKEIPATNPYPKLSMVGTNFYEPECPDYWCNLQNAVQWEGPGTYGQVLTTGGKRFALFDDSDEVEESESSIEL